MKINAMSSSNIALSFKSIKILNKKKLGPEMIKVINDVFSPIKESYNVRVKPIFVPFSLYEPDFLVTVTKRASGFFNRLKAFLGREQCLIETPEYFDGGIQFKSAAKHFIKSITS